MVERAIGASGGAHSSRGGFPVKQIPDPPNPGRKDPPDPPALARRDGGTADPDGDLETIRAQLAALEASVEAIVPTQTHIDHVGATAGAAPTYSPA